MPEAAAVAEVDADEVLSEVTGDGAEAAQGEPVFTLELNQDQKDIREWVHGFAEGVVRPAASEWDEREETPWPVIQEAAKIGLYSFEAMGQFWGDPTGLTLPIANEELFWGDAAMSEFFVAISRAKNELILTHADFRSRPGTPVKYWRENRTAHAQFLAYADDSGDDVAPSDHLAVCDRQIHRHLSLRHRRLRVNAGWQPPQDW